jgi:hypothetical protein
MSSELVGQYEIAVLEAVDSGALGLRRRAASSGALRSAPAPEALVHDALRRCECRGLLRSRRDGNGRRYELTRKGRSQLRAQRRFALALAGLLSRPAR